MSLAHQENHYDSRPKRETEVASLFHSVIEPAKLRGVDPKACRLLAGRAAAADRTAATLPQDLLQ